MYRALLDKCSGQLLPVTWHFSNTGVWSQGW